MSETKPVFTLTLVDMLLDVVFNYSNISIS